MTPAEALEFAHREAQAMLVAVQREKPGACGYGTLAAMLSVIAIDLAPICELAGAAAVLEEQGIALEKRVVSTSEKTLRDAAVGLLVAYAMSALAKARPLNPTH